ncbi:hypothetical protein CBM2634_B60016 [Cupriavidus taiwanensis]|uniref:Uncharacterized protein n=1 Tax=Cupriavidus taiwanensis TaxID=164546 RepID=A0A375JBU9_9BURK|nr:hypothetical protein CBM2634_B60016 [Cupriavidus taiwanensis]
MDGELRKIAACRCGAGATSGAAGVPATRIGAASTLPFRIAGFHSMKINHKSLTAFLPAA